ncbi:hypothetical protein KVV02_002818 [Mortierella alpina]|uniref:Uncharacterized protein n=1 Tax=Mortierella alpina TaxID=64518 RepID=A0A9P8CTM8_MORAP|nr:hypothetical protein KVV02_002818 [Mortierella alpina]
MSTTTIHVSPGYPPLELFALASELHSPSHSSILTPPLFFDEEINAVSEGPSFKDVTLDVVRFGRKHLIPEEANKIASDLWKAGRLSEYTRSLTAFQCLGHSFVVTLDIKLHLVWDSRSKIMFLKPLPAWCTNHTIVEVMRKNDIELYENLIGFLFSYSRLIRSRHDFELAKKTSLIWTEVEWEGWRHFVNNFQTKIPPEMLHGRYRYGPLRLDRLNLIKRTNFRSPGLFYHNVYPSYGAYFEGYFQVAVLVFAFLSIMLSCGQLLLGIADRPVYMDGLFYYVSFMSFWITIGTIGVITLHPVTLAFASGPMKFVRRFMRAVTLR